MERENWKNVTDRYFTPAEQAHWAERMGAISDKFDANDYQQRWHDLGGRIEAALPLDPASEQAAGFVREWFVLLEPFTSVASPEMMAGSQRLYANMEQWEGHGEGKADPGFSHRVFAFIQDAARAHPGMRTA